LYDHTRNYGDDLGYEIPLISGAFHQQSWNNQKPKNLVISSLPVFKADVLFLLLSKAEGTLVLL
jgi:hypothetical protein